MNLRRVAPADWGVGLSGAVLIGSLWLPWYRAAGHDFNAWQSMAVNDVLLFIAGGLGIAVVIASLTQLVPPLARNISSIGKFVINRHDQVASQRLTRSSCDLRASIRSGTAKVGSSWCRCQRNRWWARRRSSTIASR